MNNKKRQSGIELMRIIAIYMIMLTHATYLTFGFPTLEEVRTDPEQDPKRTGNVWRDPVPGIY